jgi:uncharacterized protein (TIGR00369 family)
MITPTQSTNQPSPQLQQLAEHVLDMPMAITLGLAFTRVAPGDVEVEIPIRDAFSFRPGQLQATPVFAIADFAAMAAAGTLLPAGWLNATVDATLKLVAPAKGALLRARGRVVHAGKLLTVCAADVFAVSDSGQETLCATLLGTARNISGEAL